MFYYTLQYMLDCMINSKHTATQYSWSPDQKTPRCFFNHILDSSHFS